MSAAEILASHQLPSLLNDLKERLDQENERRGAFREWLDEDTKAEFIDGAGLPHSPVKAGHAEVNVHASNLLLNFVRLHNPG